MLVKLIILYLLNSQVKLEQRTYTTMEECQKTVRVRVVELDKDPRVTGLFAGCAVVEGQSAER